MTRYDELPIETQYARKHTDLHAYKPNNYMYKRKLRINWWGVLGLLMWLASAAIVIGFLAWIFIK